MTATQTTSATAPGRPPDRLGGSGGYGSTVVHEAPRASEAKARAGLRLALEGLGCLVTDLATAERAAARAHEMAWDKEAEIEEREALARKRRQAAMTGDEEARLIDGISAGASLVDEIEEKPDPELDKLKAEAAALRAAAGKLKSRLPERREHAAAQRPYPKPMVMEITFAFFSAFLRQ
jgi:hypothetical protein